MPDTTELLPVEEYRALRATIRERGSLRLTVTALTFSVWAAAILTTCALFDLPLFSLIPLTVLAAGFEIVFALHIGVERIGRYIQVHYEPATGGQPGWEHTAMAFAPARGGPSPLVPTLFIAATLLNFMVGTLFVLDAGTAGMAQNPLEIVPAVLHGGLIVRIVFAARYAVLQRARDLKEFERLANRQP